MREFHIALRSLQQVEAFVSLAMVQPFEIMVGNARQQINGKDLMGMFSLDYSSPLSVQVFCSQEEFDSFQTSANRILA